MTESVDEVRKASVLGFVFVAGVDLSRKMLKLVTPAGGDLPGTILVKGRIEWLILAVCFQNSCLEWVEGTDTYKMKNDKLT